MKFQDHFSTQAATHALLELNGPSDRTRDLNLDETGPGHANLSSPDRVSGPHTASPGYAPSGLPAGMEGAMTRCLMLCGALAVVLACSPSSSSSSSSSGGSGTGASSVGLSGSSVGSGGSSAQSGSAASDGASSSSSASSAGSRGSSTQSGSSVSDGASSSGQPGSSTSQGDSSGGSGASGSTSSSSSSGSSSSGGSNNYEWANGAVPPDHPTAYTYDADTVTDTVTGLIWQRAPAPTTYTWQQALDYCAILTLAGSSDWRLPALIELESIVDYSVNSPAINTIAFPSTPNARFWSSSPFAQNVSSHSPWHVSFYDGTSYDDILTGPNTLRVRCVR